MNKKFKVIKIDHVAIAVDNLNESSILFNLLGMNAEPIEYVKNENVNVIKFHPESNQDTIELLESTDDLSTIKSFLDKKGKGLHHIALEVDNIYNAIAYLEENSIKIIYKKPQIGANNKLITFIHPSSTPGVLIELCQTV